MDLRFFEIYRNAEYITLLLEGAVMSAALTLVAGVIGFAVAATIASLRYYAVPWLSQIATGYVEFIRNLPSSSILKFWNDNETPEERLSNKTGPPL